jgi:hypothetical protein
MYHAAAVRQSRDQTHPQRVPLWTETACRFPPKPPAGLDRNRLSETPKFALALGDLEALAKLQENATHDNPQKI